jgi:hypothetical protein
LSALSVLAVAPAQAVVLDFDSLPQFNSTGSTNIGNTYTEDGFTLSTINPLRSFSYVNRLNPAYTGSVALAISGSSLLTRTDGGTFTLSSIDVAKLDNINGGLAGYIGTKIDGSTVNLVASGSGLPQAGIFRTLTPSTFTNLISVRLEVPNTIATRTVQFDNINVTPTPIVVAPPATDVPEPLTILGTLFGAGYSVALKRKLATSQQDKTDIN